MADSTAHLKTRTAAGPLGVVRVLSDRIPDFDVADRRHTKAFLP